MVGKGTYQEQFHQIIYDNFGNEKGKLTKIHDQIIIDIDDKLKKIGKVPNNNQTEKGYKFSSIISETFQRTLNKTKWMKRDLIPNHPNLASLPIGYQN